MIDAGPRAIPPKISRAPSLPLFAGAVLAFVMGGALAFVFFFNPSTHGFYPECQFHRLTGLNCPGCGATRALYALLHGEFGAALRDNGLFVASLALAGALGGRFFIQKRRNARAVFQLPLKLVWVYLMAALLFAVLRNLPAFWFLSPQP